MLIVKKVFSEIFYFRHVFTHYDGTTTGPNSFAGPLGKELCEAEYHKMPVADFERLSHIDATFSEGVYILHKIKIPTPPPLSPKSK